MNYIICIFELIWDTSIRFLLGVFAMDRWRPSADSLRYQQVLYHLWALNAQASARNEKSHCESVKCVKCVKCVKGPGIAVFSCSSSNRSLCRAWQALMSDSGLATEWRSASRCWSLENSWEFLKILEMIYDDFGIYIKWFSGNSGFRSLARCFSNEQIAEMEELELPRTRKSFCWVSKTKHDKTQTLSPSQSLTWGLHTQPETFKTELIWQIFLFQNGAVW